MMIFDIFDDSLKKSTADQTELVCESEELYLSRFAENKINANIGRLDRTIWCRAINGKKIGIAKTNIFTPEAVDELVNRAIEVSNEQHDDPRFDSLVNSEHAETHEGFVPFTADYSASAKAESIKRVIDIASKYDLETSGIFQNSRTELTVANSLGTRQHSKSTEARFSITLSQGDDRTGYAQAYTRDAMELDFEKLAHHAVKKASRPVPSLELAPGPYTVILEPEAVADFLLFLGFLGFGGKGMVTHRSFMADKIGQQIMSDKITITEDPFHPVMSYMPFDYEGVPRRKVSIVENGIAKGVVYNSYYANLAGVESTGNALAPDNSFGPYPKAMVMEPGQRSLDEIIADTENAVFINHFWYLNFVNPMRTLVTGTTRDGTFLVENGKIKAPVKDMRITQSMLESFNNVIEISRDSRLVYKYGVMMFVPAMKISGFNFVSSE